MSEKYEFDARRYCFNNRDRLGHLPGGTPCADMIICELDSRAVLIEALKRDRDQLRARLAEVEAQRDGLKTTLDIIQSGFEYRDGDPKMDGTFERFQHVLNRSRMKDIAREGLAKLEETK